LAKRALSSLFSTTLLSADNIHLFWGAYNLLKQNNLQERAKINLTTPRLWYKRKGLT